MKLIPHPNYNLYKEFKVSDENFKKSNYEIGNTILLENERWKIIDTSKDILPLDNPPNTYTLHLENLIKINLK